MAAACYLRWPTIAGDLICFVADDDVWAVPATGGRAWRVSTAHVPASSPRLSPDGRHVAWAAAVGGGAPEVHLADLAAGTLRRLTWWGARTAVTGWLSPAELLLTTTAFGHSDGIADAVALRVDGGPARALPWGHASAAAVQPGSGRVAVSTPVFGEPAWRKRYRGGTAARLWTGRVDGGFVRQLASVRAHLATPLWSGERIGFTTDHRAPTDTDETPGVAQVWSVPAPADGELVSEADLYRHTDGAFYARHASGDGTRVVWESAGALWLLDDLEPGTTPRRVEVELGGPRTGLARRRVAGRGAVTAASPDATGRASAVETRGTLQWLPHRDGPAHVLAAGSDTRARLPVVLGATGDVAFVTDRGGADELVVTGTGASPGEHRSVAAAGSFGDIAGLAASPDGALLAVATGDGGLSVVSAAGGRAAPVVTGAPGPVTGAVFSPDSRWLAWSEPGPAPLRSVRLVELSGAAPAGTVVDVTGLRFSDTEPVFTRDGRHLAFLSARTFDPLPDAFVFDRSFPASTRPYLVPLAADAASPFDPSGQGRPAGPASGDSPSTAPTAAGSSEGRSEPPCTVVDSEGIADRIRPVPVPAGSLSGLAAVAGGLAWLRATPTGQLGSAAAHPGDEPTRPVLERVDLDTAEVVVLSPGVDSFRVSGDGARVLARDGDDLFVLSADHPAPPVPDTPPADRVVVDLDRVWVDVDPPAEFAQMYAEAGRRMRAMFWRADLDGVDWDAQLDRYRPLLDAVATRDDLLDVVLEAAGEFATSHAYATAPRDADPAQAVGLLGADLARDEDGTWRIARVLPGESSDPRARSPLAAPAVGIGAGDALLAVGGRPVDHGDGPNALLVGAAGKPVELTVDGPGGPRRATVVPVDSETPLRYHAWVAANRARTRELSRGRLGYLHVPDMVESGWAQLHRDLRVETALDGLVVDTRENSGGELSQLVLERIAARVRAWITGRPRGAERYPYEAPRGAVVLLADEFAGSDGDIVNAVAQQMRVGPVVGQRTWGGVIGYDEPWLLVDGSSVVQPSIAFWFADSRGWEVENTGVEPDVAVAVTPDDLAAGRDLQLERAVSIALAALERDPPASPPELPPARRGRA